MSDFEQTRISLENQVSNIASQMASLYSKRCNNSSCVASYNQCLGTDEYECIYTFPKLSQCVSEGRSFSKSSGTRLPNSITEDGLKSDEKLIICASAKLDSSLKAVKAKFADTIDLAYIGTFFGFYRGYPASTQASTQGVCKDYDPRFRPWYVSATSGSKNVILVLDISGSMAGIPIALAKSAAISVINTLGLNDFVGVVVFANSANNLVYSSIVRATKVVKDILIRNIEQIVEGGATNYEDAFKKVEQMFNVAKSDELGTRCQNSTNVVLFLTDGRPTLGAQTADQLIKIINTWNTQYKIKLFTFGLGEESNSYILQQLSCQYSGVMKGIHSSESSNSELVSAMRNYYVYLSQGINNQKPVWSEPYLDFNTNEKLVTVSKPIYYTQNSIKTIIGVAAIDVKMSVLQKYGIVTDTDVAKQLVSISPCTTPKLTECQLQDLRDNKCGINCPFVQKLATCNKTSIRPFKTPPTTNPNGEQCCGLTIGGLVGVVIGCVAAVVIILIVIYCKCKGKDSGVTIKKIKKDNAESGTHLEKMETKGNEKYFGQVKPYDENAVNNQEGKYQYEHGKNAGLYPNPYLY